MTGGRQAGLEGDNDGAAGCCNALTSTSEPSSEINNTAFQGGALFVAVILRQCNIQTHSDSHNGTHNDAAPVAFLLPAVVVFSNSSSTSTSGRGAKGKP